MTEAPGLDLGHLESDLGSVASSLDVTLATMDLPEFKFLQGQKEDLEEARLPARPACPTRAGLTVTPRHAQAGPGGGRAG